ncbi:MAG: hypothetical protein DHS20C21_06680 [Gemmatimonadota bacterium]|nr:MAG: hypothetical protein DHS20C21_06680 [Gemmatimonadota bacterium]
MKIFLGLLIAGVAAFVTGLALFQLGMLAFVRSGAEVQVPDLIGRELSEARATLEAASFVGVPETEVYSDEFGEGAVVEQRPAAGKVLRKGRKVWLTVSMGVRKAIAPSLVGMSYRQAGIVLARDNLASGSISRVHHDTVRRGAVIGQNPPASSPLPEGGRVDLLVSLGPPPESYVMPDLVGRPAREVESLLERHGLRLGERTVLIDHSVLPGTVLELDPPRGSRVNSGEAVDVVVSSRR